MASAHRESTAEKTARHAAKETPLGRAASAAYSHHAKAKSERRSDREYVRHVTHRNALREQARITAAHRVVTKPKIRGIIAEYIVALVLAVIGIVMIDGSYDDKMKRFFLQSTGISAIFFVLALSANSKKVARPALMFGLLIDVAILLRMMQKSPGKVTITNPQGTPDITSYNPYANQPGESPTGSTVNSQAGSDTRKAPQ